MLRQKLDALLDKVDMVADSKKWSQNHFKDAIHACREYLQDVDAIDEDKVEAMLSTIIAAERLFMKGKHDEETFVDLIAKLKVLLKDFSDGWNNFFIFGETRT
jgi:hypothetical protein